jgi:Tol biopolymer transport system component/DNA-binding winged helix-turn-helix (wHTH) protein
MSEVARYTFGDYELDLGRFELRRGEVALDLEPKALAVLRLLAERAPHVVDKAEIFAEVWRDTAGSDNALTRIVAQLRKALGDDAKDPRYIATISTRGYRLLPTVRRIATDPPVAPPAPPQAPLPAVAPRAWRSRTLPIAAVAAVLALSALGTWLAVRAPAPAARGTSPIGDLDLAVAASLHVEQLTTGSGFDGYVAFSPDGASIAYASDRTGRFEIYVEGLAEGSTPTSLTAGTGQCIQPAWSPDGRLIAYHDMSGNGVWVVPSRGGAAHKVADFGAHPTWSPDGRRIAFQSRPPADLNAGGAFGAESTIWIVDVDGQAAPRPLTAPGKPVGSHGMPQWWPGSDRVVFAVTLSAPGYSGAALWTVAADTRALRPLSAHERLTSEFAIAPDGTGVLFVGHRTNALWWLPVENGLDPGEPRPTAIPATGPFSASLAIAPGGRRIAWTALTSSSGVWSAPVQMDGGSTADASATPVVPASDVGMRAGNPAVSADGRIAFVGNRGNADSNIFLLVPGALPRQLTTDGHDHYVPFWIQGEDAIAVFTNHGDGPGWWRLDPRTGREELLFHARDLARPADAQALVMGAAMGTAISSNLRRLAVAYMRDGVPNLWTGSLTARRPAGPLTQRTFETVNGSFAAWSPDARWLAYQCSRDGGPQICVVDADGTQPGRQLTHEAGTHFIGEWQNDDWLLFAAKRQAMWNVMSVSRLTGTVAALTSFDEPRFYVRYPRWDLSRQRVVFERWETGGRLWSVRLPLSDPPRGTAPPR